jgi:hypothetical protein
MNSSMLGGLFIHLQASSFRVFGGNSSLDRTSTQKDYAIPNWFDCRNQWHNVVTFVLRSGIKRAMSRDVAPIITSP